LLTTHLQLGFADLGARAISATLLWAVRLAQPCALARPG
jgi:hypothetical protein